MKAKYFEMAEECVSKYFKDCRLIDVVYSSGISKPDDTRFIKIDNEITDISCSRTTKVVMTDKRVCKGCKSKSKFALVLYNRSTNKKSLAFVITDEEGKFVPLTKDHIIPKMQGGRDTLKNLQSLCHPCNQDKASTYNPTNSSNKTITIPLDEYNRLNAKQTDFAKTRNTIKKALKKCPWWMKLLGVDRYFEKRIKTPIENMGYYGKNLSKNETSDK